MSFILDLSEISCEVSIAMGTEKAIRSGSVIASVRLPLLLRLLGRLVAVLFAWSALSARAALLLDFTGGVANTITGNSVVGWEFTVTSPMVADGLGYWDEGANGLVNTHNVGIWNTNNTSLVLASTTITTGSTPVSSISSAGQWLFNDIAPLPLLPGTYVVGATIIGFDADLQRRNATASTVAGANFVVARTTASSSLTYPGNPRPEFNDGRFGPNVRIVPEPSTSLLAALATALVFRRTRRE